MLVDEKAGEKTSNLPGGEQIFILYSEISGLFHRRKCCVPLSLGLIFVLNFDFVSKIFCFPPGSFLLLFVYEHAHLTADYRGRDLAYLRHRRMGKANSHGYLLLSVCSGKIDKRLE